MSRIMTAIKKQKILAKQLKPLAMCTKLISYKFLLSKNLMWKLSTIFANHISFPESTKIVQQCCSYNKTALLIDFCNATISPNTQMKCFPHAIDLVVIFFISGFTHRIGLPLGIYSIPAINIYPKAKYVLTIRQKTHNKPKPHRLWNNQISHREKKKRNHFLIGHERF